MPVARVDRFLPAAINSLKNQTFDKFDCHILTGQLDPSERQKLDVLISNDCRFVVHQLSLGGIAFALNYGLNLSKSKYTARMDGDDISHPLRFENQIKFLEQNPNHVAVGCRVELIDQDGNKLKKSFKFYENNFEIRKALKYRMPFCHPAVIFRTSILMSNNGYMYGNTAEDHELYLRMARDSNCLFKNLPEKLFSYRRHQNQLTNIKYAKKAYCNMAGFLFTEFLLSHNPMYIVGIIANQPVLRRVRNFLSNR
jgi:O86/O127-antigen biosynthesis beta-1,3-galactosyltransferase